MKQSEINIKTAGNFELISETLIHINSFLKEQLTINKDLQKRLSQMELILHNLENKINHNK